MRTRNRRNNERNRTRFVKANKKEILPAILSGRQTLQLLVERYIDAHVNEQKLRRKKYKPCWLSYNNFVYYVSSVHAFVLFPLPVCFHCCRLSNRLPLRHTKIEDQKGFPTYSHAVKRSHSERMKYEDQSMFPTYSVFSPKTNSRQKRTGYPQ